MYALYTPIKHVNYILQDEMDFEVTEIEVRNKIRNMTKDYRRAKDHNNRSGRNRKSFPYMKEMDGILGDRATTRPTFILDTSREGDLTFLFIIEYLLLAMVP